MPENGTYVERALREFAALQKTFRSNWLLGIAVLFVLSLYGAYEGGWFHKKETSADLVAEILKQARDYHYLYMKLEALRQEQDEAKDAQIRELRDQLSTREAKLQQTAKDLEVLAPDHTSYAGVRTLPSQAVDAWTRCVQTAGLTRGAPACEEILRQEIQNVGTKTP